MGNIMYCMWMWQATADALNKRKAVGVLFSANWSTLCQEFAAHLTSFYNSSQTWRGTNFEVRSRLGIQ